ncbi:hypothetical protein OIO90_001400 [Microbotryomycetes sp. JL221]|nr:hypothetical protein OIO90_001400 [Microbotryomycetes sp. JL221]
MHSSRLKKKVDEADNGQYGNLDESFVTIGTPLPSIASKKDQNEFKPLWEQEVYDEQGRRRLHGAFTGGWSAGYFNTVGSKEGWTPSTFKSSRSNRAQSGKQDVQDAARAFMDEEDLAELESSRKLETAAGYSSGPSKQDYDPLTGLGGLSGATSLGESSLPGVGAFASLASLIEPASSRVGAKLMRKMGWRDGQGVGPRLKAEQRRRQARELGVHLPGGDDSDEAEDGSNKHYFAPLDRPLAIVGAVSGSADKGWGLGYKPGPTMHQALAYDSRNHSKDAAFANDDEDDGVYDNYASRGHDQARSRVVELWDDDEDLGRAQNSKNGSSSNRNADTQTTFTDGTPILGGFKLQPHERIRLPQALLPPSPPKDWQPDPTKVWAEASTSASVKGKGRQLGADERGSMLGEQIPGPGPQSVFDYLSARDRQRLDSLKESTSQNKSHVTSEAAAQDVQLSIPAIDAPTAIAALKGFQPFGPTSTSPDPVRQARYTLFLKHCANLLPPSEATLPFGPRQLSTGKTQSMSELNRELSDYAQAARVFKPMSTMLAGRFTSGGATSLPPQVAPGLYQPPAKTDTNGAASADNTYMTKDGMGPVLVEKLTPAQQAVRSGIFGDATRTTTFWRPARLLCKRFGVPDPHKGVDENDLQEAAGQGWKEATARGWGTNQQSLHPVLDDASMDELKRKAGEFTNELSSESVNHLSMNEGSDKPYIVEKKAPRPTIETVGLGDDEHQGQETLTYERAPKDIFTAIFADSDEEDDSDDDDEDETEAKPAVVAQVSASDAGPVPERAATYEDRTKIGVASSTNDQKLSSTSNVVADTILSADTVVDFKPSFAPRTTTASGPGDKASSKKDKKKSSKRSRAVLSFDVEDEGDSGATDRQTKVTSKKRKSAGSDGASKSSKLDTGIVNLSPEQSTAAAPARAEHDDDEWAEAAPSVHPDIPYQNATTASSAGPRGRFRASDLF